MLQTHSEPLHDDYRRLLAGKDVKHPGDRLSWQHGQDVVFPDEAGGQSDLRRSLEAFGSHPLLGLLVDGLIDLAVGTLRDSFEQVVLVVEF